MLEKEVKQYKRGNSFTYRIDLSKKDNFEGGEKIVLLTLNEYEDFNNKIYEYKKTLDDKDNLISDLRDKNNSIQSNISNEIDIRNDEIAKKNNEIKNLMDENQKSLQKCYDIIDEKDKSISKSNEEIRLERERNNELLISKNNEIQSLNSKLNDCLKESMEKNNVLTGYRLLIERYKARNFIDRLLNREPSEKDLSVGSKDTYILETQKDD